MNTTTEYIRTAPRRQVFAQGLRDGIPIGLGYFAVAFSLGIAARNAGLSAWQGFLTSLLINASAGEYVGFTIIAIGGTYLEMALMTFIANARYLLMSCALSQKFHPATRLIHRLAVGYYITDELFGIAIARDGFLDPYYSYGAIAVASPAWAFGTLFGVIMGNMLPVRVVSALSVALYGMFIAIIIPPSRKNRVVAAFVLISFVCSWGVKFVPVLASLSGGTMTILLTVLISAAAAILFPVRTNEEKEDEVHDA